MVGTGSGAAPLYTHCMWNVERSEERLGAGGSALAQGQYGKWQSQGIASDPWVPTRFTALAGSVGDVSPNPSECQLPRHRRSRNDVIPITLSGRFLPSGGYHPEELNKRVPRSPYYCSDQLPSSRAIQYHFVQPAQFHSPALVALYWYHRNVETSRRKCHFQPGRRLIRRWFRRGIRRWPLQPPY